MAVRARVLAIPSRSFRRAHASRRPHTGRQGSRQFSEQGSWRREGIIRSAAARDWTREVAAARAQLQVYRRHAPFFARRRWRWAVSRRRAAPVRVLDRLHFATPTRGSFIMSDMDGSSSRRRPHRIFGPPSPLDDTVMLEAQRRRARALSRGAVARAGTQRRRWIRLRQDAVLAGARLERKLGRCATVPVRVNTHRNDRPGPIHSDSNASSVPHALVSRTAPGVRAEAPKDSRTITIRVRCRCFCASLAPTPI